MPQKLDATNNDQTPKTNNKNNNDQSHQAGVPLAIIGYACRLPGGVVDGESYWQLLTEGIDAVSEIPTDRWNTRAFSGRAGL